MSQSMFSPWFGTHSVVKILALQFEFVDTRNTSSFLGLHAGTIHESNLEHLLVFKAPCGTINECNRNTSLFLRLHAGMIHESNPEHLLIFKAPRGDDQGVQSRTPPCY